MMSNVTKRVWILLAVLSVGFSSIYLLPKSEEMKLSRLSKELPKELGAWGSEASQVSAAEKKILAADTDFARRSYTNPSELGFFPIEVSVVFSGKDINNSLHRPEVCLRAQGWEFVSESYVNLEGIMPDGSDLSVKEIVCIRRRVKVDGVDPPKNKQGEALYDKRIQYYTFFGHESIVSGHYQRTWADIKARLLNGYDQQWAYATFSVPVTSVYEEQGVWGEGKVYDDEEARGELETFIKLLLPRVIDQEK